MYASLKLLVPAHEQTTAREFSDSSDYTLAVFQHKLHLNFAISFKCGLFAWHHLNHSVLYTTHC